MNGLEELMQKYTQEDDVGAAIIECEKQNFDLMRQYPTGVPSGVMFTASAVAVQKIASVLAGMIVETSAKLHEWSETEEQEQLDITQAALALVSADAMNTVLSMMKPEDDDGSS